MHFVLMVARWLVADWMRTSPNYRFDSTMNQRSESIEWLAGQWPTPMQRSAIHRSLADNQPPHRRQTHFASYRQCWPLGISPTAYRMIRHHQSLGHQIAHPNSRYCWVYRAFRRQTMEFSMAVVHGHVAYCDYCPPIGPVVGRQLLARHTMHIARAPRADRNWQDSLTVSLAVAWNSAKLTNWNTEIVQRIMMKTTIAVANPMLVANAEPPYLAARNIAPDWYCWHCCCSQRRRLLSHWKRWNCTVELDHQTAELIYW